MTYPAAQSIQESFPGMADPDAEFAEVLIWYDGFKNDHLLKLLPHEPQDLRIIAAKMEDARQDRDFKTADSLRAVLRKVGVSVKNKGELAYEPDKP